MNTRLDRSSTHAAGASSAALGAAPIVAALAPVLGAPAVQRAGRNSRLAEQRRAAHWALAVSASAQGLKALDPALDERGAPLPFGAWHWSLAHSRALAAAVVAPQRVGIDIERPRHSRAGELVLDSDERALLGAGEQADAFLVAWTAKEAALKWTGSGLQGLSHCRIRSHCLEHAWEVQVPGYVLWVEIAHLAGHTAAIALEHRPEQPIEWRLLPACPTAERKQP